MRGVSLAAESANGYLHGAVFPNLFCIASMPNQPKNCDASLGELWQGENS
jgi:hypothetical protein